MMRLHEKLFTILALVSATTFSIRLNTYISRRISPPPIQAGKTNEIDDFLIRNLIITERIETNEKNILHTEIYNSNNAFSSKMLPAFLRAKPTAKSGIRTFSSSSSMMDLTINEVFTDISLQTEDHSDVDFKVNGRFKIGLMVYMWVHPDYRGSNLGDLLLKKIYNDCIKKGDQFLLIVHDDNGSGKLIEYYLKRGFVRIDSMVPKGMIKKL